MNGWGLGVVYEWVGFRCGICGWGLGVVYEWVGFRCGI